MITDISYLQTLSVMKSEDCQPEREVIDDQNTDEDLGGAIATSNIQPSTFSGVLSASSILSGGVSWGWTLKSDSVELPKPLYDISSSLAWTNANSKSLTQQLTFSVHNALDEVQFDPTSNDTSKFITYSMEYAIKEALSKLVTDGIIDNGMIDVSQNDTTLITTITFRQRHCLNVTKIVSTTIASLKNANEH